MRDRDKQNEAKRKWATKIRLEAVKALGGRCQGTGYCPEDGPDKLLIVLKGEARKWDQQTAYKRIAWDPTCVRFASLICRGCRTTQRSNARWLKENRPKKPFVPVDKLPIEKVEIFNIGGQVVKKRAGEYDDVPEHLLHKEPVG